MKILYGFTDTGRFLKRIVDRISDEEYAALQFYLCEHPATGDLIQGGGGIRKMRWRLAGQGKSGGVRIIYYWAVGREKILMLDIYRKNEKDNLSRAEIATLRQELKIGNDEKEDFEGLLESVKEAGEILRGERKPAREFFIEVDTSLPKDEGYALCVKSDEPELLVPFKVYPAKFSSQGRVGIVDEEGEAAVYPPDFFIRIKLPDEVEEVFVEYQKAA